jgi:hypothetical protein
LATTDSANATVVLVGVGSVALSSTECLPPELDDPATRARQYRETPKSAHWKFALYYARWANRLNGASAREWAHEANRQDEHAR